MLSLTAFGCGVQDGIAPHYTTLTIPIIGVYLNPALELR